MDGGTEEARWNGGRAGWERAHDIRSGAVVLVPIQFAVQYRTSVIVLCLCRLQQPTGLLEQRRRLGRRRNVTTTDTDTDAVAAVAAVATDADAVAVAVAVVLAVIRVGIPSGSAFASGGIPSAQRHAQGRVMHRALAKGVKGAAVGVPPDAGPSLHGSGPDGVWGGRLRLHAGDLFAP